MKKEKKPLYLNRELSWLEFNSRVLSEALETGVPLLERLKFLSIVSSNLDEFFMVRVASLKRSVKEGSADPDISGMAPAEQLEAVSERVRELVEAQYGALNGTVLPGLAAEGLVLARPADWTEAQRSYLESYFKREVFSVLVPVRVGEGGRTPPVGNLRIHIAFILAGDDERMALVQIPPTLPRFIPVPAQGEEEAFALLDDVVLSFGADLCPGQGILDRVAFQLTRDADFAVDEERDEDFVSAMEEVLSNRQASDPVRLCVEKGASDLIVSRLAGIFGLPGRDVYSAPGPADLRSFMELCSLPGFDRLRDEPWKPVDSVVLGPGIDLWDELKRRDALLFAPYESFDPVVRFLDEAADDPATLAIKMTLYRTSGDSPVVKALERAARNGKQVMALVELKARFDEDRNISWANSLERAGAIVVHGVARLKVHAKAAMVVRRERDGIHRYLHLSTGNYNDKTAKLYADLSLFTADEEMCYEAALFFNAITGYSEIQPGRRLTMAPFHLKAKIIAMIDREATRRSQEYPGLIEAKMNALTDPDVIQALYCASRAGVKIKLNVRGICMLVPGVAGLSENISVVSVVDRYLEHARILYFSNGGVGEVYLSSADWMERNLEKRIELLFPVLKEDTKARAVEILESYFADTAKAHDLDSKGRWTRRAAGEGQAPFRAQAAFRASYLRVAEAFANEPEALLEVRRRPAKEER